MGEALAELGYEYLFQLRFWRGRSLLEEGVRLLSRSAGRQGFLIRAKRKLVVARYLTGQARLARTELAEVQALALSLAKTPSDAKSLIQRRDIITLFCHDQRDSDGNPHSPMRIHAAWRTRF